MTFIVTDEIFTPALCRKNPKCYFVFGDNWQRWGKAGQAAIRDEPNAVGVPTKRFPSRIKAAFLSDAQYSTNVALIEDAIRRLSKNAVVYVPRKIGRGLAKLHEKAPKTYAYLCARLEIPG